jgi:hypothetical protein
MSKIYAGPSIDASYQVPFIWLIGFRGEDSNMKGEQTDNGRQVMTNAHITLVEKVATYTLDI